MNRTPQTDRKIISPSAIAQFYKLQQCPMYLYHRYVDDEFAGVADISISPLLAATGEAFETEQLQYLLDARVYSIGPEDGDLSFDERWSGEADADIERLRTIVEELVRGDRTRPVVFYQPRVQGTVGAWPLRGDADVVIATANGRAPRNHEVDIRVAELKSSSTVQTHHQLQTAIYSLLLESILEDLEVKVTASIVSQDPDRNDLASIITPSGDLDLRRLGTFELESRQNDVRLLLEEGGTLDGILLSDGEMRESGTPPTYRIDARCDGCSKQAKCLAHSITNHKLALLGLTEGVQESLRELGIEDLHDLATLYEWPAEGDLRQAT